jgi:hypothetical protein
MPVLPFLWIFKKIHLNFVEYRNVPRLNTKVGLMSLWLYKENNKVGLGGHAVA